MVSAINDKRCLCKQVSLTNKCLANKCPAEHTYLYANKCPLGEVVGTKCPLNRTQHITNIDRFKLQLLRYHMEDIFFSDMKKGKTANKILVTCKDKKTFYFL